MRQEPGAAEVHFRTALAQLQLSLRTECKRASALPTAMFGAADPMLEARLAQAAETMMQRLQEPSPDVAAGDQDSEPRIEDVSSAELARLPDQLRAAHGAALDLEQGLAAEYLSVLGDACSTATPEVQRHAQRLLSAGFGISSSLDFESLAQLLQAQLEGLPADDDLVETLAAASRRLAAAALSIDPIGDRNGPS